MKETVQAHHGQVTFLRVSASFRDSLDNIGSRDHLISCGTDCTVRIWELMHPEMNRVTIHQKALVKLLQSPRDLAMAGNTLCMAMTDNNVVMCRYLVQAKRINVVCFALITSEKGLLFILPLIVSNLENEIFVNQRGYSLLLTANFYPRTGMEEVL